MARGEPLFRQWCLLKTLQAHRFGIALDELAERLECSPRQVRRDLGILRDVGFPIDFEPRDFGKRFWKLSPRFIESHELALSMTEMLSLYLSQQLLAPLSGTQFGDGLATALQKIRGLLPKRALGYFLDLEGAILVKNLSRQDYTGKDTEIRVLNEAIVNQHVVKITYRSASKGREVTTHLHPYGIVLLGTALYCIGWLEAYGEVRTLRVSRMLSAEPAGTAFEKPATFSLAAYTHGVFGVFAPGKYQTVRVRFTGWAATNVREQQWHASQRIVRDTGEAVTAEFELANTVEFKRWILGFGRHATALKPRSLVREIVSELEGARSAYGR